MSVAPLAGGVRTGPGDRSALLGRGLRRSVGLGLGRGLGSGLGGQSALLTRQEGSEGDAWLAFEERRFDAFRAYYRYVPKGRWTLEYTVRLNNPGEFHLPATRVEAMYAPEMFGEAPNADVKVEPKP